MSSSSLKTIKVSQLRLGMHVHALGGDFLQHPFWKTQFLLDDPQDLALVRNSTVPDCVIDTALGLDVLPEAGAPAAARPAPAPQPERVPMAEELKQAAQLCARSREVISGLLNEARLGQALDAQRCQPLVEDITQSVFRNPGALVSLSRLKTADDYSYMHSVAVCVLMVSLGQELGMDDASCREAGLAGLLHDLGKAAMPLEILNKPGKLTDAEFAVIRTHPERGWQMLQEARGASAVAMDVCLHHHERIDGKGYPEGLSGDKLSVFARMGAVCDVYDAITSNRPYKAGWDPAESIAQMASWKGHLDPALFKSFVKSLGIYPTGSLVRLQSGRLAVVLEQHPQSLALPVVKVFFSTRSQMPVPVQRVELARSNDRIVSRENPGSWGFKHLDELWRGEEALQKT